MKSHGRETARTCALLCPVTPEERGGWRASGHGLELALLQGEVANKKEGMKCIVHQGEAQEKGNMR